MHVTATRSTLVMECYTCWWNTVAANAPSGITLCMDVLDGQPMTVSLPPSCYVAATAAARLFARFISRVSTPRPVLVSPPCCALHPLVCFTRSYAHLLRPRCVLVYFLRVCAVAVGRLP